MSGDSPDVSLETIMSSTTDGLKEIRESPANNIDKSASLLIPYKYTLDDYKYIMSIYDTDMESILKKYGLKDKSSLYKLKYKLTKRFAKTILEEKNKIVSDVGENQLQGGGW